MVLRLCNYHSANPPCLLFIFYLGRLEIRYWLKRILLKFPERVGLVHTDQNLIRNAILLPSITASVVKCYRKLLSRTVLCSVQSSVFQHGATHGLPVRTRVCHYWTRQCWRYKIHWQLLVRRTQKVGSSKYTGRWQYKLQNYLTVKSTETDDSTKCSESWQYKIYKRLSVQNTQTDVSTKYTYSWQYKVHKQLIVQSTQTAGSTKYRDRCQYK